MWLAVLHWLAGASVVISYYSFRPNFIYILLHELRLWFVSFKS